MLIKTILTIAGSDSGGGAGIQADLKTAMAHGVFCTTAITALTAQNTSGISGILDVPPDFLKQQIDAVFPDFQPDAVKIGMTASEDVVRVILDRLQYYHARNIVLDTVLSSTSGTALSASLEALRKLMTIADIITPNIPEAEILSGMEIHTQQDMLAAAELLHREAGCAVLCKGGHSLTDADDLLYLCPDEPPVWFRQERISNPDTHGTGCTLSSAIACNLAIGMPMQEAVQRAKEFLTHALRAGLHLGHGNGPLHHGFSECRNV